VPAATPQGRIRSPSHECAVESVNAALGEASIDLKSYGSREFSVMLIEAVKGVHSEFEGGLNGQQVRSSGPEARGSSTGQLAGPVKGLVRKRAQEKDPWHASRITLLCRASAAVWSSKESVIK